MPIDLNLNELGRQLSGLLEENSAAGMLGAVDLSNRILQAFQIGSDLDNSLSGGGDPYPRYFELRDEIEQKLVRKDKFDSDYLEYLQKERELYRIAVEQVEMRGGVGGLF